MEKELYEKLSKLGFTPVVAPLTNYEKFINFFNMKPKYIPEVSENRMVKTINGIEWEVVYSLAGGIYIIIGGDLMPQDLSRFTVDEFLTLIPQ